MRRDSGIRPTNPSAVPAASPASSQSETRLPDTAHAPASTRPSGTVAHAANSGLVSTDAAATPPISTTGPHGTASAREAGADGTRPGFPREEPRGPVALIATRSTVRRAIPTAITTATTVAL